MNNRAILFAGIVLALGIGRGVAADLVVTAPPSEFISTWTGLYIGVNAGYAWGNSDPKTTATCGQNPPFYFNCNNVNLVQASGTRSLSSNGFVGGGQVGYNLQNGSVVYGVELDFEALSLKANTTTPGAYAVPAGFPFATSISVKTDWLFTARGRLGWTVTPNALIYATGGLALADIEVANSFTDFFTARGAASNTNVRVGWTIGAGAEWMVAHNWTVKAEYLFVDLPVASASSTVVEPTGSPGSSSQLLTSATLKANIVRAGVNYKF
jgi:outer membrane immunogenic protein